MIKKIKKIKVTIEIALKTIEKNNYARLKSNYNLI